MNYIFLALIVSFLWGIQTIFHKVLLSKINSHTIMLTTGIANCFYVIIFALYNKTQLTNDIKKIDVTIGFVLLLLPFFTTFSANVIYYYILKKHESSLIAAIINSSPIFTLIFAYLFLNEIIDIYGLMGIISIIIGVILISQNKSYFNEKPIII